MKKIDERYWKEQYSDPSTIDGIGNAKDHSQYLEAFFNIEGFKVESLIDFGFGPGHLMKEVCRRLKPRSIEGIEPSEFAFKKVRFKKAKLYQEDLKTWCATKPRGRRIFDLGICTSVLQYLSDEELKSVLPIMAERVRFLYLTLPTDQEYRRQSAQFEFGDPWAYKRSRKYYQKLLGQSFTFLSTRMLESKVHFNEMTTPFQDLLFRF